MFVNLIKCQDDLIRFIRRVGGQATRTAKHLNENNAMEPDGHASIGDRTLLFDVTGRSQLAASQQNKPGLLCNAANAKEAKYASMARNQHADFVPFAFGVYGEFEPRARSSSNSSPHEPQEDWSRLSTPNASHAPACCARCL